MRAKYSIGLLALLVGASAVAATCPNEITTVAQAVGTLRGVPQPFAPPCRLIGRETLAREIERKLRRDLPVNLELFVEALIRLGFVEGRVSEIVPRIVDFYRGQVLGFYEPATDEMVIVQGLVDEEGTAPLVWAHELEHAAQEQRFGLPTRLLEMSGNGDAQRAASAIAEGDALLVMFLLAVPAVPGVDALALAETALSGQVASQLDSFDVPDYFVQDLLFPYTRGFSTVLHAYRKGGWISVDRLLAHPPASTAALLHPDRPPIPQLTDAVLPPPPPGYDKVLTDSLGEWGLSYWLGRRMAQKRADELAAAWRGDRLLLARSGSAPEEWALALRVHCVDAHACSRLQEAMQEHAAALLVNISRRNATLVWSAAGPEIELRAGWPEAPRVTSEVTTPR